MGPKLTVIFFGFISALYSVDRMGYYTTRAYTHYEKEKNALKQSFMDRTATYFGYERPEPEAPQLQGCDIAKYEALKYPNVSPALAYAVCRVESRGRQFALSEKGAIGLMQVTEQHVKSGFCKSVGVKSNNDLLHDQKNVACGVKVLAESIDRWKDVQLGIYGYNGSTYCVNKVRELGTKHLERLGDCKETAKYLPEVLKELNRAI